MNDIPDLNLTSEHSAKNRIARLLWNATWLILFRPSPRTLHSWRIFLLRCFGARIGRNAKVYSSARIWAPWNLELGDNSVIGDFVDCYCVAQISIGRNAIVSQYSFLCAASHDYTEWSFPLLTAPICICDNAWVAADVFLAPGVTIGEGAVVGARSSVFKNVEPWMVVGGNPAKPIKRREMKGSCATGSKT